jgi:GNAT superfamily N-acetyltransferase
VTEVHVASPDELDDVLAVLDEAAAWLQSIGVTQQWPASFSGEPAWAERFQRWLAEGCVYLARDADGIAVGTFRLMPRDVSLWQDDSGRHLYVHSLAVRRSSAGGDVAPLMLAHALEVAASRGAEELRLDCWAGNERLLRYYEDAGFESRGQHHVLLETPGVWGHQDYWVAKFARPVP